MVAKSGIPIGSCPNYVCSHPSDNRGGCTGQGDICPAGKDHLPQYKGTVTLVALATVAWARHLAPPKSAKRPGRLRQTPCCANRKACSPPTTATATSPSETHHLRVNGFTSKKFSEHVQELDQTGLLRLIDDPQLDRWQFQEVSLLLAKRGTRRGCTNPEEHRPFRISRMKNSGKAVQSG